MSILVLRQCSNCELWTWFENAKAMSTTAKPMSTTKRIEACINLVPRVTWQAGIIVSIWLVSRMRSIPARPMKLSVSDHKIRAAPSHEMKRVIRAPQTTISLYALTTELNHRMISYLRLLLGPHNNGRPGGHSMVLTGAKLLCVSQKGNLSCRHCVSHCSLSDALRLFWWSPVLDEIAAWPKSYSIIAQVLSSGCEI